MLFRLSLLVAVTIAQAGAAERICSVTIQDHSGNSLAFSSLNKRLVALLESAGYESASVQFRPAADVDHEARTARCSYILYTDVVEIRHSGGAQVADAVRTAGDSMAGRKARGRDVWAADVEFRLFALDEAPPLIATSVTGRNAKPARAKGGVTAETAAARSVSPLRPEPDMLTQTTPMDQDGRMKKHKSVAVAAALEREAKAVRDRLKRPAPATD